MKPTVFYIGKAEPAWPDRAWLIPINHRNHVPGQGAVNYHGCTTSRVLHWNHETGRIETQNTVYVPCADPGEDEGVETSVEKPIDQPVRTPQEQPCT